MSEQEIIDHALAILKSRLQQPAHFFTSTTDATSYLKLKFADKAHESFRVLFLNAQHGLIEEQELFRGTIDSSPVYPREVVKAALHFNAARIILTHNHPSGKPEPSHADKAITKRLVDALKLVDISVLDHIVIAEDKAYSFAEHGLLMEI